jgi:hypothetical protein
MPSGGRRQGAGRKNGSPNRDTARARAALADLAGGHVEIAIAALADIARDGDSESARVSASVALLDRVYGRPIPTAEDTASEDDTTPTKIERVIIYPAISAEARADIDAARKPSGALDPTRLSPATLEVLAGLGDRPR